MNSLQLLSYTLRFEILQKDYQKVVEDCSKAIELNSKYLKCIQRRARAAENIGNLELALEGGFQNRSFTFI